jgi:hypothetical protein
VQLGDTVARPVCAAAAAYLDSHASVPIIELSPAGLPAMAHSQVLQRMARVFRGIAARVAAVVEAAERAGGSPEDDREACLRVLRSHLGDELTIKRQSESGVLQLYLSLAIVTEGVSGVRRGHADEALKQLQAALDAKEEWTTPGGTADAER